MCELFGFTALRETSLDVYLTEFFSHSENHPDGWGMLEILGSKTVLQTEPISAKYSVRLAEYIKSGIQRKTVLGHIRKATVGGIKPENCHPFLMEDLSGNSWSLIHNGTIFNGLELISYQEKQTGNTDSERIILYLIDKINTVIAKKGGKLNSFERFQVIDRLVSELSYRNKLNLILFDGNQIYVHTNMKNTLFYKAENDSVCFSTVPLDDGLWSPIPLTTLFVYESGKLKYKGKNHHNEYVNPIYLSDTEYDYNI